MEKTEGLGQGQWSADLCAVENFCIKSISIYTLLAQRSTFNMGGLGSIPGLGTSPGEGNGYTWLPTRLENSADRGTWQATVHRVGKSQTQLSYFHFTSLHSFSNVIKHNSQNKVTFWCPHYSFIQKIKKM